MTQLSRPAGPVPSPFNPEQQARFDAAFDKAVSKYPPEHRKAALLPALHAAQDLLGWLPEAAMAYVGSRLDVPPARVREVATFYTMYRLRPVGRQHIEVCNNISCWAMGSEQLMGHLEKRLGVKAGEVTKDGQFSWGEIACTAACGYAPAILVNNYRYEEFMTVEKLDQLIAALEKEPGTPMADFPLPELPGGHH